MAQEVDNWRGDDLCPTGVGCGVGGVPPWREIANTNKRSKPQTYNTGRFLNGFEDLWNLQIGICNEDTFDVLLDVLLGFWKLP